MFHIRIARCNIQLTWSLYNFIINARDLFSRIAQYKSTLLCILIGTSLCSNSQPLQRTQSIGAYMNNFPKHIIWENENTYNDFNIILISENPEIINEFQKLSKSTNIKEKPVKLTVIKELDINTLKEGRLIFIADDKKPLFMDVFDIIEGKPILLVSENLSDKRFVMINLYDTPEKRVQFEINKANIINQKLKIDDEILFLGGNVIDVAELYRKSQQSLRSIQKTLDSYEHKLDSLNSQISTIQNRIQNQNKTIDDQNRYIENQKNELKDQLRMINDQKSLLEIQNSRLTLQRDSIFKQFNRLRLTEKQLERQNEELDQGKDTLKKQQVGIRMMDEEIQLKTKKLDQLIVTISRQRQIMLLFGVVIFLIVALVIIIFNANRNSRIKNAQLKIQKAEIETFNEELRTSNEELNSKNEEITITLEKLKYTQNQLIQSEKMASLGVLTAGIAHELNNPINFVYAGVNSLKKDFLDLIPILEDIRRLNPNADDIPEIVKSIQDEKEKYSFEENYESINQTIEAIGLGADRATEIIKGLRNFSRLDKEELKSINIHDNLDDVLILLKNKYKNHIDIIKEYDLTIPPIECIPGKINQVFMNIINNAIDAIEEKGKIIIKTNIYNGYVFVSIKDSGKGMSEIIKSNIFDPFFTTKEIGRGVGLGLSITYGIINEHSGEIDVKSEEGKGAEFIVKLPILQSKKT